MAHYLIWITVAVFASPIALRAAIRALRALRLQADADGAYAASSIVGAAVSDPTTPLLIYAICRESFLRPERLGRAPS
jgi:hypothetical protein